MIIVVYGVPGSGKTYYAVHYLLKKGLIVFEDGIYRVSDGVLLITNIKNLKVEGLSDWDALFQSGRWYDFSIYPRDKKVIFVIDEAQQYFSKLSQQELYFFQYHRHYGFDILLITQNLKQIDDKLVGNAEYLFRALPKSDRVFGAFRYHLISSVDRQTVLKKFSLNSSEEVFFLYSSFEDFVSSLGFSLDAGSPARSYVLKAVIVAVVAFFALFFFATNFFRLPSNNSLSQGVSSPAHYEPLYERPAPQPDLPSYPPSNPSPLTASENQSLP